MTARSPVPAPTICDLTHGEGKVEPPATSFICSGVRIDEVGPEEATEVLLASRFGHALRFHLCNAYTLSLALRDRPYREMLNQSNYNFADGHYVAMVGRWRGSRLLRSRVYGPSLMLRTVAAGRRQGLRHYLYGGTPETVSLLAAALGERSAGARIVGYESAPFRDLTAEEEQRLIQRVHEARPDILWVGLGTPRQDKFVARYAEQLRCSVVPVGAAFDFIAGTKRSAPALAQRFGMEWLFRLTQEPVRLWRRYLFGIPTFLVGVLTDPWYQSRTSQADGRPRSSDPAGGPTRE